MIPRHSRQGHPGDTRISCPRCRANNFPGQPQCWQCRAPLPPPETLAASAAYSPQGNVRGEVRGDVRAAGVPHPMPVQPPMAVSPHPSASVPIPQRQPNYWLLMPLIALITFAIVWFVAGRSYQTRIEIPPANGRAPGFDTNPAGRVPEAVTSEPPATPGASTGTAPTEADPLTAQAQREIERAKRGLNLPPPNAVGPDGRVRLRGGGSISVEEWEAARRKLQDSPLTREPPPPPPF